MLTSKDYTETGLRLEGAFENDRNQDSKKLFTDILREVFKADQCIIGHHICYEAREKHSDGYEYSYVQEIPSADALIFDHDIAKRLWGDDWRDNLKLLALEPPVTRDKLLAALYAARNVA